jgi:hypothetical protein
MATICSLCDKEVSIMSRAAFGLKKTLDKKKVCHDCVKKIMPIVGVFGSKKWIASDLKLIITNEALFLPKQCQLCSAEIDSIFKKDSTLPFLCSKCASNLPKHTAEQMKCACQQIKPSELARIILNMQQPTANSSNEKQNLLRAARSTIEAKNKKESFDDNQQGANLEDVVPAFTKLTYNGGHPDYVGRAEVALAEANEGIIVLDTKVFKESKGRLGKLFSISWEKISGISTNTQIETKDNNKMAAAGMLLGRNDLALIAATMKKDKKHNYLLINYKIGTIESVIKFEGDCAEDAASYFIAAFSKRSPSAPESGRKVTSNAIEQLRQLAELKKEGILTENEFAEQKQKLLTLIH